MRRILARAPALALVALLPLAACEETDVPDTGGQIAPGEERDGAPAELEVEPVDLEEQAWFREDGTVEFGGRSWSLSGEPIYDPAVEYVGEYQGTPLYADVNTMQPYSELFIPLENDLWQMLVPEPANLADTLPGEMRGVPGIDPVGDPADPDDEGDGG